MRSSRFVRDHQYSKNDATSLSHPNKCWRYLGKTRWPRRPRALLLHLFINPPTDYVPDSSWVMITHIKYHFQGNCQTASADDVSGGADLFCIDSYYHLNMKQLPKDETSMTLKKLSLSSQRLKSYPVKVSISGPFSCNRVMFRFHSMMDHLKYWFN